MLDGFHALYNSSDLKGNVVVIDSVGTRGRFSGYTADPGRLMIKESQNRIKNWITENCDTSLISFRFTGSMLIYDKIQSSTIANMFTSLMIALILVGVIVALISRNHRITLIVLFSNLYPIIFAAALMPVLGIQLRYSTSLVFTIGYVIVVDDSIHFVSGYILNRRKHKTANEALFETLKHTGNAIMLTSLVLFFAFMVLVFSSFKDSSSFGSLATIMITSALIIDIVIVPVLLKYLVKSKHDKILNNGNHKEPQDRVISS